MTAFRTLLLSIALAHAGCGASHSAAPEQQEPEPAKPATATNPAAMPMPIQRADEPPDADDPSVRPPPMTIGGELPPPDPACPADAPGAGSACSVAPGSALSCAWQVGEQVERCACVWRDGMAEGTPLTWNCDDGASGEGPEINLCPEAAPATDSPCLMKGNHCRYAVPASIACDCDPGKMVWKCGGDIGAQGGE